MYLQLFTCLFLPLEVWKQGWMWLAVAQHFFPVLVFTLKIYLHLFSNEKISNYQFILYEPLSLSTFVTFGRCRIKPRVLVFCCVCVWLFIPSGTWPLTAQAAFSSSQLTFYRWRNCIREVMKLAQACTAGMY